MADERSRGAGAARTGQEQARTGQSQSSQQGQQQQAQGQQDQQQRSGPDAEGVRRRVEEAATAQGEARDVAREVQAASLEFAAASGPDETAGSDDEHPLVLGTDVRTLEGVPTFLEQRAGSDAMFAALVDGDPFGLEDNPGAHLADGTIAHGTPVPATAGAYREARARAGIPEPVRVDRNSGSTLLDTPGGLQIVAAGWTPDELAREQSHRVLVRGVPTSFPSGEEAGARVRHVGGRELGTKGQ